MRRAYVNSLILLSMVLVRCGGSTYFSAPTPDPLDLTCSSKVLDYGVKSSLVTRGAVSDVKIPPGSHYPAMAYSDGALSLKFTYWDGNEYTTEVVAGDYNATSIRLVFLSTGLPWIFWQSAGSYVKAALRSAPIGQSGTWSAAIIDTGTTSNTLEVSINPLDQIGILHLTETAVTGRPRFLYCTACTSLSGFRTMSAAMYVEDTNVISNEFAIGMAWCKVNSTTYYPAVAYAVTGNTKFGVCRQSSLSNCLSSSNWDTQVVVATGNTSTKLYLDQNVVGDVPKVASLGAGGIDLYQMGSTACTATPTAFTAGGTLGGATSGNRSMTILKDAAGKFHLVGNESTTSFRYYNSQTTNFTGAWNSAGVIQTTTLTAPAWTGADIDTTNSAIYASFGSSNLNADVRLARVMDYTVASSSANFRISQLDGTGSVQLTASPKKNIAMASTSRGIPAVAYVDYSAAAYVLKYSIRQGTSASDTWQTCIVPDAILPQSPGIIFDENDYPWISYFDVTANRFNLATKFSSDCSGTWITYEFPHISAGAQLTYPATNDTAVSIYGQSDGILMAVVDTNAGSRGVFASRLTPSTGNWSDLYTVSSLGSSAGAVIDMTADRIGNAAMVFQDLTLARTQYSASIDGTSWSVPVGVSYANQGMGSRIRFNPTTGFPMVSYFDRANNSVYYTTCQNTPMACTTDAWPSTQIDSLAGVSGLTNQMDTLLSASLIFTDLGVPYIIYPRGKAADGSLVATGIGSTNTVTSVIARGANANFADTPAFNFAVAGWGVASAPNAAGFFTSAYIGPGNWLYVTSCGD